MISIQKTRKHPLRECILAPLEGLRAWIYPGFDIRSSASPRLRQLFAVLKTEYRPFLAFIIRKGPLALKAKYKQTIPCSDARSSASPCLKQLFVGLNTKYWPLLAFFGLHWPQRPFCLKGLTQRDYSVLQYIRSSVSPPLQQLFAGLKTEYRPFSAFKGHKGRIRIAYCVLRLLKALTFNQVFWLK